MSHHESMVKLSRELKGQHLLSNKLLCFAVADPEYSRVGGANSRGGGGTNIRFCQKFPKTV